MRESGSESLSNNGLEIQKLLMFEGAINQTKNGNSVLYLFPLENI